MTAPTPDTSVFLSPKDVARLIGLHYVTVTKMLADGRIPGGVKWGNKWRIARPDWDRFVATHGQRASTAPTPVDLVQRRKVA
jgi:excisionase family DNA binding protein